MRAPFDSPYFLSRYRMLCMIRELAPGKFQVRLQRAVDKSAVSFLIHQPTCPSIAQAFDVLRDRLESGPERARLREFFTDEELAVLGGALIGT